MMKLWPGEGFTSVFERIVLSAVQLLLMVLITIAVLDLAYLMWLNVSSTLSRIDTVGDLQKALQRGFAGALLIMIGLELLETARAYLLDRHIRLEVIVVVAVIAVSRHIIQLDVQHLNGFSMIGIASLVVALMFGYWVARRSNPVSTDRDDSTPGVAVGD